MIKKAVILAAGEGKRLRPFTETMPKVMLPVANKPILEYVFDSCKNSGIKEIVVVVGYKKESIMDYFENYKDLDITYVFQEKQLGTAHALLQAQRNVGDSFIVFSGDNIIDQKSIIDLINDKSPYSLLIKETTIPSKYGVVIEERKTLKKIVEKPEEKGKRFVSTGIYKFTSSIFEEIEKEISEGDYSLSSVIQSIVNNGTNVSTNIANLWMDIAYPWDLLRINETMSYDSPSSIGGMVEKGVTLKGKVTIGKNTNIYSGSYIVGPVVIGEGCEVGPNTCIFPASSIGHNSVINPFSEIINTVIMDNVHIGSNSFISNSIIGMGSTLRKGFSSMVGETVMEIEGEFNKLDNIGTMIGSDCVIESNTITAPGVVIGRRCNVGPMNRIFNNIPSLSKVI